MNFLQLYITPMTFFSVKGSTKFSNNTGNWFPNICSAGKITCVLHLNFTLESPYIFPISISFKSSIPPTICNMKFALTNASPDDWICSTVLIRSSPIIVSKSSFVNICLISSVEPCSSVLFTSIKTRNSNFFSFISNSVLSDKSYGVLMHMPISTSWSNSSGLTFFPLTILLNWSFFSYICEEYAFHAEFVLSNIIPWTFKDFWTME